MKRLLTLVFILCFGFSSYAQDNHFTQYNYSPLNLNPAFTGAFFGTFRIGGIYRDQFFNVEGWSGSFSTPNVYIDAPIIRGFRKKDWVGVGVDLWQDQAGSLEQSRSSIMGSAAYHFGLGKSGNSTFTVGLQLGYGSNGFQAAEEAVWGTAPASNFMPNDQNYFNMSAGVMYRGLLSDNALFEAGLSVWNLTAPEYGVESRDQLDRRFTLHSRLKYYMTEELTLTPSLLYSTQGQFDELSLQATVGFAIDKEREIDFNAGLGFRVNPLSSLQLLAGLDWKGFKAGFGYDFGLSSDSFTGQQPGGFELAAGYIAKIYRKPQPKPTIFCPRF